MSNALPPEQLLVEIEDILRTMPPTQSLGHADANTLAWLGRASAVIHAWDPIKAALQFDRYIVGVGSAFSREFDPAVRGLCVMLNQARHDLRIKTIGPLSVSVGTGAVFDYFDEIRQVIEVARADLLFVDPYLDAEFVSRYLPHVCSGVSVRLLAREKMASLTSSVQLLRAQTALEIEVRSTQGFHDRYIFVDGATCHQSGASFKDGAKKAATTITQITDAFAAVKTTYEDLWLSAMPHP